LGNDIFEEAEIICHLIVASADTRFSVATPALNELNKICTTLDWFDPKMPMPLYTLFLGNGSKLPDRKTSAVSPRVKIKILNHLLKCRGNAINVAKGVQVIFEGLFGETTNQKCKVAALQFATNVISNGQPDIIEKLSKVFQTSISKLIGDSEEPTEVQNAAYQALAKLIAICPATFNKDVKFIVDYFNFLTSSPPELHNSIRECMLALAQAFKWDPSNQKEEPMEVDEDGKIEKRKFIEKFVASSNHLLILGVLKDQCESNLPIARNIASLFLTTCFPSYFVPARYLLIVLCGTCTQLKETIYGYLYGSQRKDHVNYSKLISCDHVDDDADEKALLNEQKIILPGIKPLIHYIDQLADKKITGNTTGTHKIAFHVDVFTEILDYMHLCLWFSAGCSSEPGSENEMHILSEYIENLDKNQNIEHIEKFTKLIRNILVVKKGMTELSCLSSLIVAAPLVITKNNLDLRTTLTSSLKEVNESVRMLIAKIYGILLAYGSDEKSFNDEIKNLLNNSQKSLEHQHGSIMALSNAFFYRIMYSRQSKNDSAFAQLLSSAEFNNSVTYLIKLLTDPKSLLTLAAIKGISQLGCSIKLPLEEIEVKEDASMDVDENQGSKNYVFKTLVQLLKSSQTKQKIREDSAHCLGHLCIGDAEFFGKR
jgi:proteasome component ECM29